MATVTKMPLNKDRC